ncbi:MAG: hypothetical protein RBU21_05685, partial [FCB group bacterium]|nr:hypothetical protein [FCB group bacterium]
GDGAHNWAFSAVFGVLACFYFALAIEIRTTGKGKHGDFLFLCSGIMAVFTVISLILPYR